MTKVVSILNLKGGVAKTTLTVALADTFAIQHQSKKILVIDLDPQCDTSIMLVGHDRWETELQKKQRTLASYFIPGKKAFDLDECIEHSVSDIKFGNTVVQNISLLASDTKLADVQDGLVDSPLKHNALAKLLKNLRNFDLVLIDCPPNFGFFTRNALFASATYIIPAIPDYLSLTLGATRTIRNVNRCKPAPPKLAGIVLTKYQASNPIHKMVLESKNRLNDSLWDVMLHKKEQIFPQASKFTEAAYYHAMKRTYSKKYPDKMDVTLKSIAYELWQRFS